MNLVADLWAVSQTITVVAEWMFELKVNSHPSV